MRANIDKKECKISSGLELQQSTVDIRLRPRLGAAPGGSFYAFVVVLTPAAPCWVTLNIRLFASHIRGLKLICKYYVVHKTGSAQRIATLPEIDWSTAIGDVHKNLMKIGHVVPEIWWRTDKHRQTDNETNKQTDMLITILRHPYQRRNSKTCFINTTRQRWDLSVGLLQ